jgi:hypothetical protein
MKTPPFPYQLSRHGWISVSYDQNIWIPCPPVFPEGLDRRSWAMLYAEEWWSRTSRPHGKREINALARTLADLHAYAYRHLAMHRGFLHLPSLQLVPQLVSFGIWEAVGDREEQLRLLTRADDPAFMQSPRSRNSAPTTSGRDSKSSATHRKRTSSPGTSPTPGAPRNWPPRSACSPAAPT